MKIYAYARISTAKQNIDRQIRNILAAYPDAEIFQETFTGTKFQGRDKLNQLLSKVQNGDTIVFDSVSRMSRNADEGFELYEDLYNKGVSLVFLKEPHINTDTYKSAMDQQLRIRGIMRKPDNWREMSPADKRQWNYDHQRKMGEPSPWDYLWFLTPAVLGFIWVLLGTTQIIPFAALLGGGNTLFYLILLIFAIADVFRLYNRWEEKIGSTPLVLISCSLLLSAFLIQNIVFGDRTSTLGIIFCIACVLWTAWGYYMVFISAYNLILQKEKELNEAEAEPAKESKAEAKTKTKGKETDSVESIQKVYMTEKQRKRMNKQMEETRAMLNEILAAKNKTIQKNEEIPKNENAEETAKRN